MIIFGYIAISIVINRIDNDGETDSFRLGKYMLGIVLLLFIIVVPLVRVSIVYVRGGLQYRRLRRNGVIVEGEVYAITSKLMPSPYFAPKNASKDKDDVLAIIVKYQFITPNNRYVVGEQVKRLDKARHEPFPVQGTPIKVLYGDDSAHVML